MNPQRTVRTEIELTTMNGADALVRMLQLNGVKHIFGLCGDTSLPSTTRWRGSTTAWTTC
jgi:thiamine pyrophosphate-dependent acetolactate synthase large subunit-like protein